ncbi:MAG: NAD-binding protein [Gemmataceae bacterium]|nr:NAD-binding protein [Gemmataceae bacterium]
MRQHFILCGLGRIGWRVLEQLRTAGADVVAVDNRCRPDDPRLDGATLVSGDCRDAAVLRRAGLEHARGVLILTSDDLVSLSTALLVRDLHPTVRVVVRLFNQQLLPRLGACVGNMQALSASALSAPLLALIARTGATVGVVHLGPEGRGPEGGGQERRQIATLKIAHGAALVGRRLGDIAVQRHVEVVCHLRAGQPVRFLRDVDLEALVAAEDRLVVCGAPESVRALAADVDNESLPELLWAGTVKRFSRVLARGVAQVDLPLKICATIFLTVVIASVIIFRFGMKNDTIVDAFYRTISLLATGADMHGHDVDPGSWQKAFISSMRLVGTALTAAFTAIFTNYLIRANLGGALEVRRIPESGHIIVCGLGNVGFRVAEELLRQGERVVVIESNAANSFIATARRLGAAVIIGNANVAQVLRQANAATARAVVTATSDDLVNVEIGLLVRELAPKQRVVLRLIDAQLARTLRQSADMGLAVSIPELAAPAFVAALYGDQVRGMFQIEARMVAVYDLVVRECDSDARNTPLEELGREHRFLPMARTNAAGAQLTWSADTRLAAGDRLTVLISLDDLQQWLARETTEAAQKAAGQQELAQTVQSTTANA